MASCPSLVGITSGLTVLFYPREAHAANSSGIAERSSSVRHDHRDLCLIHGLASRSVQKSGQAYSVPVLLFLTNP